jgi:hypothetical protein
MHNIIVTKRQMTTKKAKIRDIHARKKEVKKEFQTDPSRFTKEGVSKHVNILRALNNEKKAILKEDLSIPEPQRPITVAEVEAEDEAELVKKWAVAIERERMDDIEIKKMNTKIEALSLSLEKLNTHKCRLGKLLQQKTLEMNAARTALWTDILLCLRHCTKNANDVTPLQERCQPKITDCDISVEVKTAEGPPVFVVLDDCYNTIKDIHAAVSRAYRRVGIVYPVDMAYETVHGVKFQRTWLDHQGLQDGDLIIAHRKNVGDIEQDEYIIR